jgi:hypothetical protein
MNPIREWRQPGDSLATALRICSNCGAVISLQPLQTCGMFAGRTLPLLADKECCNNNKFL